MVFVKRKLSHKKNEASKSLYGEIYGQGFSVFSIYDPVDEEEPYQISKYRISDLIDA